MPFLAPLEVKPHLQNIPNTSDTLGPLFEALVTSVLLDRPDEPIGYMINWLKKKDSTTAGASVEDLKLEVFLKR